jgi:hypothetical protein
MTTITSISLPVRVHDDATHVIIDADGNVIAECGPHFAGLDGSGRLLQQAETIAAELVHVLNAHDDLLERFLMTANGYHTLHVREAGGNPVVLPLDECELTSCRLNWDVLAAARGEPVS